MKIRYGKSTEMDLILLPNCYWGGVIFCKSNIYIISIMFGYGNSTGGYRTIAALHFRVV